MPNTGIPWIEADLREDDSFNRMKLSILVKVQPRARKQSIEEVRPGEYRVHVLSAPEKGEANRELLRLLAEHLKIPPSRLKIVRGGKSRHKLISLE